MQQTPGAIDVDVPGPAQDRPKWKSVAIIAGVGFVVGVAWPRLAGVRLGPSLPEAPSASPSAAPSAAPSSTAAPGLPSALVPSPAVPSPAVPSDNKSAPSSSAAASGAATPGPVVAVSSGAVLSCKTVEGDALKGSECGKLGGLDALLLPRLRKLADCPEAADVVGKLGLVVRLDFAHNAISADLGHSQSVSSPEPLLACARTQIAGANVARVTHDNQRYNVAYAVTFGGGTRPPDTPPAPRPASESSEATATVVWEVAIVRDVPKTGKVLARLQRGTQIRVGPVKDGWYPVQYGDGFTSEGWVYRGAIGR